MNKDKLDSYVEALAVEYEQLENTLQFVSYEYLLKGYKQPQLWYKNQNDALPRFKAKLNEIALKQLELIIIFFRL